MADRPSSPLMVARATSSRYSSGLDAAQEEVDSGGRGNRGLGFEYQKFRSGNEGLHSKSTAVRAGMQAAEQFREKQRGNHGFKNTKNFNLLGAFQRKYEILGMSRSPEVKYEN
ncbi:hypothetical protein B0H13DRAFT_1864286 [Mycena leptocephala]|nr:hypothetical protein B0H13DRAFT_1864286 [Mycena leptocephala]